MHCALLAHRGDSNKIISVKQFNCIERNENTAIRMIKYYKILCTFPANIRYELTLVLNNPIWFVENYLYQSENKINIQEDTFKNLKPLFQFLYFTVSI